MDFDQVAYAASGARRGSTLNDLYWFRLAPLPTHPFKATVFLTYFAAILYEALEVKIQLKAYSLYLRLI